MIEEEGLEEQGFILKTFPWHDEQEVSLVKTLTGEGTLASDVPFPGAAVAAEEIAGLRYSLTPEEVARYRWLGERVSTALERTVMDTRRGEKESEVVGRLCRELWKDRIDPVTLMAAADERVSSFRHPIPSERPVEKYLMVSVNARKWGLIVSLTRFVHFGKVPEELREKYLANVYIDCAFMAASRPGAPARDVLRKGLEAYRERGYPEEWQTPPPGRRPSATRAGTTGRISDTPDIIAGEPGLHLESLDHGHQV